MINRRQAIQTAAGCIGLTTGIKNIGASPVEGDGFSVTLEKLRSMVTEKTADEEAKMLREFSFGDRVWYVTSSETICHWIILRPPEKYANDDWVWVYDVGRNCVSSIPYCVLVYSSIKKAQLSVLGECLRSMEEGDKPLDSEKMEKALEEAFNNES